MTPPNQPAAGHFPSVRLAVAGFTSLALLAWIAFVPGSIPPILFRTSPVYPVAVIFTAAMALLIVIILTPVVSRGPRRDRWLALLLVPFPLLTVFWLSVWAIYGQ